MVKDFLVFLILGLILLLYPNIYGSNPGLCKKSLAKLQEFLKPKYKKFISVQIYPCDGPEGQPATLKPMS